MELSRKLPGHPKARASVNCALFHYYHDIVTRQRWRRTRPRSADVVQFRQCVQTRAYVVNQTFGEREALDRRKIPFGVDREHDVREGGLEP